MAIRFFKKFTPATKVSVPGGGLVQFDSLDGIVGYFATDSDALAGHFEQMIRQQRYGLTEIGQDEFHLDFVQKKTSAPALQPVWRDEFRGPRLQGKSLIEQVGADVVAAAAGVDSPDVKPKPVPVQATEATPVGEKPVVQEFKPVIGKRPKVSR